jgi:hypothetical protein
LAQLDENLSLNTLSKSFVRSENLLEHIVASFPQPSGMKGKHPNHGAPWREEDDKKLTELFRNNTAIPDLMTIFGRSRGGITSRLRKLNLT